MTSSLDDVLDPTVLAEHRQRMALLMAGRRSAARAIVAGVVVAGLGLGVVAAVAALERPADRSDLTVVPQVPP